MDGTHLLRCFDDTCTVGDEEITMTNAAIIQKYDLDGKAALQDDHDYDLAPALESVSKYKQAAISYIAGYVARMVERITLCRTCRDSLGSQICKPESSFLEKKDRGGLFKPARSVLTICEETERNFQILLHTSKGKLPQGSTQFIILQ